MSGKKNLGKALKEYMAPKPSQEDARKVRSNGLVLE